MNKIILTIILSLFGATTATSETYYVRADGGSSSQCTGLVDAAYDGSGTGEGCAWKHPWSDVVNSTTWGHLSGGDTLTIGTGTYPMGYSSDFSSWCSNTSYGCIVPPIPAGTEGARTKILGKGWDTKATAMPVLSGVEFQAYILNMAGSSYTDVRYLDITDGSACGFRFYPPGPTCSETAPRGNWGKDGLVIKDASHFLLKDLKIHGMANDGIVAGRLSDFTVEDVEISKNSANGWNGDLVSISDNGGSKNSGSIQFTRVNINYNGCLEDESGNPSWCSGRNADGIGTGATCGAWEITDCDMSHNTHDGLDLLYLNRNLVQGVNLCEGEPSSVTVKGGKFIGNAGNQLKLGSQSHVENVIADSQCDYFVGKSFRGDFTETAKNITDCRASGDTVVFAPRNRAGMNMVNSTISGDSGTLVTIECSLPLYDDCGIGSSLTMVNNIFNPYGDYDSTAPGWLDNVGWIYVGNVTPGLPDAIAASYILDYNLHRNQYLKYNAPFTGPMGSHSIVSDPGFVNNGTGERGSPPVDVHLVETSLAKGAAVFSSSPAIDNSGAVRIDPTDMGALIYAMQNGGVLTNAHATFKSGNTHVTRKSGNTAATIQ